MPRPRGVASASRSEVADPGEDHIFYEEYLASLESRMLRTVWRIVHDEGRARDALQDALVVVWRRRERVRAHANPEALILRICIHAAIDATRREKRHEAEVELSPMLEAQSGRGPTAALEARELREHMLAALGRLSVRQASAVWLRIFEEYPYRTIAQALECTEVTARIHVMRGRARLRRLLAHLAPTLGRRGGET